MGIQDNINHLDQQIDDLKQLLVENHYMNPEQEVELESLIAKAIKFGELCAKRDAEKQWTSISDQKPEQGQKVLLFRPHANKKPHGDPIVKIAKYIGDGLFIGSHFEHLITHWMPIPEYPLQEKK